MLRYEYHWFDRDISELIHNHFVLNLQIKRDEIENEMN